MGGDRAGLISGGVKCEAGRLLACDCAKSVGSVGGKTTEEVASGAEVDEIARLLRDWVRLDEAGAGSVDVGRMFEDDGIGVACLVEV